MVGGKKEEQGEERKCRNYMLGAGEAVRKVEEMGGEEEVTKGVSRGDEEQKGRLKMEGMSGE